MVANPKPPSVTRRLVADLVRNYIRQGMTAVQAGAQVIADMRGMGLESNLLDTLGPAAVVRVWQEMSIEAPALRIAKPVLAPKDEPSTRRIDTEKLKESTSLLEGMYQIDGVWQRLGDLDKAACRAAATQHKASALEEAHTARYFHELAKALNGDERVRDRFDNDSLMRLWDVAGRDS